MNLVTSPDGTRISYRTMGEGDSMLIVHGTLADSRRWEIVAGILARRYHVANMDRRGRGPSGDGPSHSIALEAGDIASVANSLPGTVTIVAHSYGAVCALEASLASSKIGRLILYEPFVGLAPITRETEAQLAKIQGLVKQGDPETALRFFFSDVTHMLPARVEELSKQTDWRERIGFMNSVPREALALRRYQFDPRRFVDAGTPTVFLLGDQSPDRFRAAITRLRDGLPSARLMMLPGQEHQAMTTAPELLAETIENAMGAG